LKIGVGTYFDALDKSVEQNVSVDVGCSTVVIEIQPLNLVLARLNTLFSAECINAALEICTILRERSVYDKNLFYLFKYIWM
jgi:hypothetical protein